MGASERFTRRSSHAAFAACAAAILLAFLLPTPALAHDCLEDPLNAADCMRTPLFRPVMVIVFGALPTIAAIIPNLLTPPAVRPGRPRGVQPVERRPQEKPEKKPQVNYAVQVSAQQIDLPVGQAASFSIKAYKSVDSSPWQPAPEVSLTVSLNPAVPGLSLSPASGVGEMGVTVRAAETVREGDYPISVTGAAPGAQAHATMTVRVMATYELYVSAPRFEIAVGDTFTLDVRALKMNPQGVKEVVQDARLRPFLPTEKDFFRWDPPGPYTKGRNELYGQVTFKITALKARQPSELCFLDFQAIYPDKNEIKRRVEIVLKSAGYTMEFF
ncbi:MAG TPA: hypothetical protein VJ123_03575 [Anaerolineales bacterium]|nr:hypothetical protein [Anaerolineales bacterium]